MNLEDQEASTWGSNIYPRGCWSYQSGSTLYYNDNSAGPSIGSSTRFPICKSSMAIIPDSICYSVGIGFDASGGSTTPNINDPDLFICPNTFRFTPYNRQGYMYLNFNPKEVFSSFIYYLYTNKI